MEKEGIWITEKELSPEIAIQKQHIGNLHAVPLISWLNHKSMQSVLNVKQHHLADNSTTLWRLTPFSEWGLKNHYYPSWKECFLLSFPSTIDLHQTLFICFSANREILAVSVGQFGSGPQHKERVKYNLPTYCSLSLIRIPPPPPPHTHTLTLVVCFKD